MNKLSTYIPSLIISIFLVLMIIFSSAAMLVTATINSDKAIALVNEKNLGEVVENELNKYYYNRYNSTGIPSDLYAIETKYILNCEKECIEQGFYALEYGENPDIHIPKNEYIEKKITRFFNEYAAKEGYAKDENLDNKINETINNAYATIKNYSDVYKISALAEHKVLLRLSRLYKYRVLVSVIAAVADLMFILLLILINRKNKLTVLYWTGISALIAGLAGSIPCAVLLANNYFNAFSIKQPAVFLAYTSAMYNITQCFMIVSIIIAVVAIIMLVLYAVLHNKKEEDTSKE